MSGYLQEYRDALPTSEPKTEPIVLVMQIHDYPEVPIVSDFTEEEAAEVVDWERRSFGEKYVSNRFLMEVQT